MSDENIQQNDPNQEAQSPQGQENDFEKRIQDLETKYKSEIAGLNRKNSELQKILKDKEKAGMSVEERMAALERESQEAKARLRMVEAFAEAGLDDQWRQALTLSDPVDQAKMIKGLVEQVKAEAVKGTVGEFSRNPKDISGERTYSLADLKGKSMKEINTLWAKGLIKT